MVLSGLLKRVQKLFKPSQDTQPQVPHLRVQALPSVPGALRTDSKGVFGCVSRHGFLLQGVLCPSCSEVVARPGEWSKIVATSWGEAVMCSVCEKVLLASPDTDMDPIKAGEPYDEGVYHAFARPVGWQPPKQRTLEKAPAVGDWVVVVTKTLIEIHNVLHNIESAEGRVLSITEDGKVSLALGGNVGLGGSGMGAEIVEVPLAAIKVMATQRLVLGDMVRILRGEYAGKQAQLVSSERGNCEVVLENTQKIQIPIERIERIEQ